MNNFFTGNPLNRYEDLTRQSQLRSTLKVAPNARILVMHQLQYLKSADHKLALIGPNDVTSDVQRVYLGLDEHLLIPYWTMSIPASEKSNYLKFGTFVDTRPNCFQLSRFEAALVAQSRAMLDWNEKAFCPACGSKTVSADAGYKRICATETCTKGVMNYAYPRTDAVAIVAVGNDNSELLLARSARFANNVYSCISGFIEPGESLEEGCQREVFEETGIKVDNITYHSSQPWPFPSNVMIGFVAHASTTDLNIDYSELVDAKWFSRADVQLALKRENPNLRLPPPTAIAFSLIQAWANKNKL